MSELFPGFTCPDPMMAGREDRCCLFSHSWRCAPRVVWERDLTQRAIDGTQQLRRYKVHRRVVVEYDAEEMGQGESFEAGLSDLIAQTTAVRIVRVLVGNRPE